MKWVWKVFNNQHFLKIFSFVAAVLLWFIVVSNINPEYKRTVYGVPIKIDESSAGIAGLKLHMIDESVDTVNIEVSGPRVIIGKLTPSDFSVTPNLTPVIKSGSYNLNLAVSLISSDARVHITGMNTSNVRINFDTTAVRELPVTVNVNKSKVADGYLMQSAEASPATVTVSGPTGEVNAVAKAVVNINVDGGATSTVNTNGAVELLDKNGKQMKGHLKLNSETVNVSVPILKLKEVPIKMKFTNIQQGFSANNLSYTVSPAKIMIAGTPDRIGKINEVDLDSIDFLSLDVNTALTLNIPALDGLVNVDNITQADVSVRLGNTASKLVSATTFIIVNQPPQYKVTVKTKVINNIKLFGPATDIAGVPSVDAIINMSGIQSGTGQYEVPVTIQVPGKTGYWATGSYTAVIKVSS